MPPSARTRLAIPNPTRRQLAPHPSSPVIVTTLLSMAAIVTTLPNAGFTHTNRDACYPLRTPRCLLLTTTSRPCAPFCHPKRHFAFPSRFQHCRSIKTHDSSLISYRQQHRDLARQLAVLFGELVSALMFLLQVNLPYPCNRYIAIDSTSFFKRHQSSSLQSFNW